MSRPAPTASTVASASSATTRLRRSRARPRPVDPRAAPASLSADCTSTRRACSVGTRPNAKPAATDTTSVAASTRRSRPTAATRGTSAGARATSARRPAYARPTPAAAAASESHVHSARNWRSSRPPLAPRARRTAISCARAVPRASSRLATLTHATSSTSATAPSRTNNAGLTGPNTTSDSASTCTPRPSFDRYVRSRSAAIDAISLSAAAGVAPGASRPTTSAGCVSRGSSSGSGRSGRQTSTRARSPQSANPRPYAAADRICSTPKSVASGTTPTTVQGWSSSRSARPTTSGSRPNSRCQSDALITAIAGPPLRSSSVVKVRPTIGSTPSMGRRPLETSSAARRTGSPAGGVRFTSPAISAPSRSSVVARVSKSWKSGTDAGSRVVPLCRSVSHTITSRPKSATGAGRSSTPSSTEKMAVLAPMPSASTITARRVKAGCLASARTGL